MFKNVWFWRDTHSSPFMSSVLQCGRQLVCSSSCQTDKVEEELKSWVTAWDTRTPLLIDAGLCVHISAAVVLTTVCCAVMCDQKQRASSTLISIPPHSLATAFHHHSNINRTVSQLTLGTHAIQISVECRGKREEMEGCCRWLCHFGQWKSVQLLVIFVSTVVAMDIFKPIWPDLWLILGFLVNSKLGKNYSVFHTVVVVLVCLFLSYVCAVPITV